MLCGEREREREREELIELGLVSVSQDAQTLRYQAPDWQRVTRDARPFFSFPYPSHHTHYLIIIIIITIIIPPYIHTSIHPSPRKVMRRT